jgi:hypothetical protein
MKNKKKKIPLKRKIPLTFKIETERLILRCLKRQDAENIKANVNDKEVVRYTLAILFPIRLKYSRVY